MKNITSALQALDVCVSWIFIYVLAYLGIFFSGPHPSRFTADLYCYYSKLQSQLSVNRVLGSEFMVC